MGSKGFKQVMCKKGHYYSEVGRIGNGSCAKCYEDYYEKNRKEIIRKKKEQLENDPELKERKKEYQKEYRKQHKEELRKKKRISDIARLENDINFLLSVRLRHRLNSAIRGNYKAGSAVRDLGCSIEFFKGYIEAKFHDGMTWDNWGVVWNLDHIEELHTFDLTDREQFLGAVHYTNMQPLTIPDHIEKTAKNAKLRKRKFPKR